MHLTSCSELVVETKIMDPQQAFAIFEPLFKELQWQTCPPFSLEMLQKMKQQYEKPPKVDEDGESDSISVEVFDCEGNGCGFYYGTDGCNSEHHGYFFESSDCEYKAFPIFKEAIDRLKQATLITVDGGHSDVYQEWEMSL